MDPDIQLDVVDGAIHLRALTREGDPVELNADEVRELAESLVRLASLIESDRS